MLNINKTDQFCQQNHSRLAAGCQIQQFSPNDQVCLDVGYRVEIPLDVNTGCVRQVSPETQHQ